MHRIDNAWAVPAFPVPQAVGTPGYFSKGNPSAGSTGQATIVDYDWLNTTQEELAYVVEHGGGLALDKTDNTQLYRSILHMVSAQLPPLPFLPLSGGTMQGPIVQPVWPTAGNHLVPMDYVNQQASAYAQWALGQANNQAYAWDQQIWAFANNIDQSQGGWAVFGSSAAFTVPGWARTLGIILVGGGGGGAGTHTMWGGGGGGAAGGLAMTKIPVLPGQQYWVQVGGGGAPVIEGQAGTGGSTQFGNVLGATGGAGGNGGAGDGGNRPGGSPGTGYGSGLLTQGGYGADGMQPGANRSSDVSWGGIGGASYFGGGGRAGKGGGISAGAYGAGGGGGFGADNCGGGWGAPGLCIVSWVR